jgi:hypothetical protein
VRRGITSSGASLLLPVEFNKKLGPFNINWELGYNAVHLAPDGWIARLLLGREVSKKLELDVEYYAIGTFHNSTNQQMLDGGTRYKLRPPFILLLMAGRSVERGGQAIFRRLFRNTDSAAAEAVRGLAIKRKSWLRGVDSNHDSQIQSLESYRLDDPGVAARSLADARGIAEVRHAHNCNDVRW